MSCLKNDYQDIQIFKRKFTSYEKNKDISFNINKFF